MMDAFITATRIALERSLTGLDETGIVNKQLDGKRR
jgi:hypothetical protein